MKKAKIKQSASDRALRIFFYIFIGFFAVISLQRFPLPVRRVSADTL